MLEIVGALKDQLKDGLVVEIPVKGGWVLQLQVDENGEIIFTHYNPWQGDENEHAFFDYTNALHPMGAGMIDQESSLGIPLRDCGINQDGKVVGFLVTDGNCDIIDRFSLSKVVYVQEHDIKVDQDGRVAVDEVEVGYIGIIFLADKNRIIGHVAVTFPRKPGEVQEIEMEDLLMCQVPELSASALKAE